MVFKHRRIFIGVISIVLIMVGGMLRTAPVEAAKKYTPTPTSTFLPTFVSTLTTTPTMTGSPIPSVTANPSPFFAPYVNFPVGSGKAVGIGDFNSDGRPDVVMTTLTQLMVFLQNPDGTLANAIAYYAGSRPEALAVGDINADNRADVVVTNFDANTISAFIQQPDGSLATRLTYPTSSGPDAVAIGDINHDGFADIVVSHWTAAVIGVFLQGSGGNLNPMMTYPSPQAGYDDIAIADINHDGKNDVIKMNGQGLNPNLSVYLQNANGALNPSLSYSVTNCATSCLAHGIGTGDVTGDGLIDIVMSYGGNYPSSKIAVFAQSPDGNLQAPVAYNAYDLPKPVEIADANLDGLADVWVAHDVWDALSIFTQQSSGTLSSFSLYPVPYSPYQPQGLAVGDLNQDGLPDAAIADSNNGLVLLYQTRFQPATPTAFVTLTPISTPIMRTISGNTGVGSVLLSYSPPDTVMTSNPRGSYTFTVPSGWSGTIRPSLAGYRFTPASRTYSNVQTDQLNQDFVAEPVFTISGNAGVPGAVLNYVDGSNRSVTSDSSGNYTLTVSRNWSGTIRPGKPGVVFNPDSKAYTRVRANLTGQDYSATITVTNTADHDAGSLRQAILDAAPGATIKIDASLSGETILLTSEIAIDKNLTIDGSGLNPRVEISGGGAVKIFKIGTGYGIHDLSVVLDSLVLKNGRGFGQSYSNDGAAILLASSNTLTVRNSAFYSNLANGDGAAIYSEGSSTVLNSEFLSNIARGYLGGGSIYVGAAGHLTVRDSYFGGNQTSAGGGAISFSSGWDITIENTTFDHNTALDGGAVAIANSAGTVVNIRNNLFWGNISTDTYGSGGAIRSVYDDGRSPDMLIENNTFLANHSAGFGGAISTEKGIILRNNTFSNNQADKSGASLHVIGPADLAVSLYNNIFANNAGGGECVSIFENFNTHGTNNLVEDGSSACLPAITSDPLLAPLAENGGPTQTMALLPGSPALDAGDDTTCSVTDQRGALRPQGIHCDIGAFEYIAP